MAESFRAYLIRNGTIDCFALLKLEQQAKLSPPYLRSALGGLRAGLTFPLKGLLGVGIVSERPSRHGFPREPFGTAQDKRRDREILDSSPSLRSGSE